VCGITGAVWWDPTQRISADILQRMTDSLRHRGPDAAGAWFSEPGNFSALTAARPAVALGHRRLSIIDVAGSPQPLGNEDGSVQISFNGEIYNYRELRLQLQQQGHQFRTDGDTEVIVHLYEQYGLDFVQHLRGMFAVAIWDGGSQRLVLARDRLGKKPLLYCQQDQRLVFASELKALLQIPDLPRKISHSAVLQFLTLQYVPHPDCILHGFQKLPPASIGVLEQGKWRVQRYWSAPYDQPQLQRRTVQDWQEELRAELTEAVRLRLRSDVPLGAFLSGGIDSTIICGLMQSLLQQPVQTFSIGFPVRSFDEREFAAEAAAFLRTSHHEDVVTPDALRILPALIWHYDEPFGDSSAIPTMYLAEMTRRRVTVALTGDGGDELFCGYERYRAARAAAMMDRIPGRLRRMLAAVATRLPASVEQRSFRRRLKRLLEALAQDPERRYLNWITIFDEARLQWLAGPQLQPLLRQEDPAQCISAAWQRFPERDFITRTTAVDLQTYLPCDILTKVDIASMAASLECRCPFLDHHVVELAARMPIEVKQTLQQSKLVLKETFRDLLPDRIRTRGKMGFGVPIDHWFRQELQPLLRDVLLSQRCLSRGLLNPVAVRTLVDEHCTGRMNHSYRLWNLLCLELWQRLFLDQAAPVAAPDVLP